MADRIDNHMEVTILRSMLDLHKNYYLPSPLSFSLCCLIPWASYLTLRSLDINFLLSNDKMIWNEDGCSFRWWTVKNKNCHWKISIPYFFIELFWGGRGDATHNSMFLWHSRGDQSGVSMHLYLFGVGKCWLVHTRKYTFIKYLCAGNLINYRSRKLTLVSLEGVLRYLRFYGILCL